MTDRIRILYIAYYFPPLGGVAAIRSLKMVKYLAEYGIDCTVLCMSPFALKYPKDKSLLKEIPQSTKVYRFPAIDLSWIYKLLYGLRMGKLVKFFSQSIFIPDQYILSRRIAKTALDRLLRIEDKLELAVISSGPPSVLFLGLRLKSKYNMRYICDFRDEWTNNPERINSDYPHRSQTREMLWEARVLSSTAGMVYLTEQMRSNFLKRYSFLAKRPFRVIPNGFDEADFSRLAVPSKPDRFTLLYTGSFYDRRQPDSLWKAIEDLVQEQKLDPMLFRVRIIGKNNPAFIFGSYIDSALIRSVVQIEGFMTHSSTLSEMQAASALLLYIPSGANTESVITGKIFDYIRSYKPILAIVPPNGKAAEIVLKSGLGLVSDYMDIPRIKHELLKLYTCWAEGSDIDQKPDPEYIRLYSRQNQAGELAELIREFKE